MDETPDDRPTVQHALTKFYPAFAKGRSVPEQDFLVLWRLRACRTPQLGGFRYDCGTCGNRVLLYQSCRDRHCTTCQGGRRRTWAEKMSQTMLPVPHFQVVFTLPKPMWWIARAFPKEVLDVLLRAASQTLLDVADYRWKAIPSVLSVLHTWNRGLDFYPHVHCVVSAGGARQDGTWYAHRTNFLFPRTMLQKRFRGKFLAQLTQLGLPLTPDQRTQLKRTRDLVAKEDWYLYTQLPKGRPSEHVLRYLAQYVHGVALSDYRMVELGEETVTFRTRGRQTRTMAGVDFVKAFAQHILPKGFRKTRHYGLLAPARRPLLHRLRASLAPGEDEPPAPDEPGPTDDDVVVDEASDDDLQDEPPRCCPRCQTPWTSVVPVRPHPRHLRGPP